VDSKPYQPPVPETNLHDEIDARARLIACMQDLIKGLGQANSDLAHELDIRRQMSGAPDDGHSLPENESLVITCGQNAVLSLPESGEWIHLPLPERNESSTELSQNHAASATGIRVSRWRPLPRLIQLSDMLADFPAARQAGLVGLAAEVVCLELARPILRNPDVKRHLKTGMFGVFVSDDSGIVRMLNQHFCRLTGRTPDELIGRSITQAPLSVERVDDQHSDDDPAADGLADLKIAEVWIRGGNDFRFPVKLYTQPISSETPGAGSVSVVMDMTDQQQHIEPLAGRERRYRRFFEEDLTGDYACTPDGRIITCNEAFARIFGFATVDEAVQCNLRQLHVSGEAADHFLESLRNHRNLNYFESVMRRSDGKQIHVIRNVNGRFNDEGELVEITGYVFDNTERKRQEESIRESQKMETVGRLAGGVAHDFNNLLLTIQGYASLLADQVPMDSEGQEAIQEIQKASDRAAVLTRQLLAFSRRQVLQPTKLNLNDTISSMSSLLQRMLGEDIELVAQLDADLGFIRADRAQLEQVLVNLSANARDAMPAGGRLTLTTANIDLRDTWFSFHDGPAPGDYVELSVQDNGVGMSDDVKLHLFEPFFTTKEQGKGAGLGLPSVYGIIKQSGGEIQAYSVYGEGSTFKIYLPRLDPEPDPEPPAKSEAAAREKTTILLVEDEEAVRMLIRKILTHSGFDVLEAVDGKQALSLMENHVGPKIPLLLTDLIMPHMNGRELYERLQTRFPEMEAIYMSGYTEDEFVKKGVMQEKVNFLQKPFNPKGLIEKITQVLEST